MRMVKLAMSRNRETLDLTVWLVAQLHGIQVSCLALSQLSCLNGVGNVVQSTVQAENDFSAVACSQRNE